MTALKNTPLTQGGGSLLDHVVAIADGGMLQTGSDEMGVFTNGCSISGSVTMMTRYQVAQTGASLPWPDIYTPTKAQTAYRIIFDGILDIVAQYRNKWGKQIAITQTMDGSEGYDWPRVDANGVPLPPQSPSIPAVAMYAPILQQAATDARQCFSNSGTLTSGGTTLTLMHCKAAPQLNQEDAAATAIFGWPGLFNDSDNNPDYPYLQQGQHYPGHPVPGVQLVVNNGALYGGGVKWQFNNDNGGPGGSAYIDPNYFTKLPVGGHVNATSCIGREGTTDPNTVAPLGDPSCFDTMLTLANQSSAGVIGTGTVLDPGGPGLNPSSPYVTHGPLLKWIEAKAIDLLPFDNGNLGPIVGPLYGCFTGNGNSYGPACPPP